MTLPKIDFDLFNYNIRKNKGLLIVFTLLLSLTFPIVIIVSTLSNNAASLESFHIDLILVFFSLMLMLLLVATPFIFFNYLNTKKSVDVYHSLPIKRSDLFLTLLSLSLFFVLIPLTFAYWSGFLLSYQFTDIVYQGSHLFHYIRLLIISVAVMAPGIFVIMNTGTLGDSLIYTGILLIAPFLGYGAYQFFAEANIIGFAFGNPEVLAYLSPLAGIFSINPGLNIDVDYNILTIFWFLGGVALYLVSNALYNEWQSEMSEEPFVNKFFFPFVTSIFIGIVFVFSLSLNILPNPGDSFISIQNLLIPVVFTYSLYVILNIVKQRSVQSFKVATKNYLILFIVILALTTTLRYTQGFGYTYRVPKEKEVQSIEIQSYFSSEPFLSNNKLTIKEPDAIQEVVAIHKHIVRLVKDDKQMFIGSSSDVDSDYGIENNMSTFDVTYHLKNNTKMKRSYRIPGEIQEIFFPLATFDEVTENNHPISKADNSINNLKFYNSLFSEKYQYDVNKDELQSAIRKDLLNMDYDTYYYSNSPIEKVLIYNYKEGNFQLNIDQRFTHTLEILNTLEPETTSTPRDVSYIYLDKEKTKNEWVGHGFSSLIQQYYYINYYPGNDLVLSDVKQYEDFLYDKHLSQEENEALLVMSPYGEIYYPIIKE